MSRPIPGKNYTVVSGDTLSLIAARAYGDPEQWSLIKNANIQTLKSDDPNLVYPGEVLIIPVRPEIQEIKDDLITRSSNKTGFRIEVGGRDLPIISGKIIRTMDTAADAWSAVIPWTPGFDQELDRVTAPYSYEKSKAYIDDKLQVTGPIFTVKQTLDTNGIKKSLVGYSATVSIVDSDLLPEQLEQADTSIRERSEQLLKSYGLRVFAENGAQVDDKIERVAAQQNEKIFDHLLKIAREKQVLISSTPKGNLLLTKANVTDPPIAVIEESTVNSSLKYEATFDGRKRFSNYRVTCQTPDKLDKKVSTSRDKNVPIMRFKNVNASNVTSGNIESAANWQRSKQFAEALTIPFPVPSWYAPNGELWEVNKTIVVKSPTISVPDGYKFLIRQVEFNYSADAKNAVLSLVPPETYTGQEIKEPWI